MRTRGIAAWCVALACVFMAFNAFAQTTATAIVNAYGTGGYRYLVVAGSTPAPDSTWTTSTYDDSAWLVAHGPLTSATTAPCTALPPYSPWPTSSDVYIRFTAGTPVACVSTSPGAQFGMQIDLQYAGTVDAMYVNNQFVSLSPVEVGCTAGVATLPYPSSYVHAGGNLIAIRLTAPTTGPTLYTHQVTVTYPSCGLGVVCHLATNACGPLCVLDGDCDPSTYCLAGLCVQCGPLHPCPTGRTCTVLGTCVQCNPGDNPRCVSPDGGVSTGGPICLLNSTCGCIGDDDCGGNGSGVTCTSHLHPPSGTCVAGCVENANCPVGTVCTGASDAGVGSCVPGAVDAGVDASVDAATDVPHDIAVDVPPDVAVDGATDVSMDVATTTDLPLVGDVASDVGVIVGDAGTADAPLVTDVALLDAGTPGAPPIELEGAGGCGCTTSIPRNEFGIGWIALAIVCVRRRRHRR